MSRSTGRIAASLLGAAILAITAGVSGASAVVPTFEIVLEDVGDDYFQVGICFNAADQLPARLGGTITVRGPGGALITERTWTPGNPTVIYNGLPPCPTPFEYLSAVNLNPGTHYTVHATMSVAPKIEGGGWYTDDPARPAFNATADLSVDTTGGPTPSPAPPEPPSGGGSSSSGSTGSSNTSDSSLPATSTSTSTATTPTTSAVATGVGSEPARPATILNPRRFTARQLAALSPTVVSEIPPATLAALRPAVLRTLTPSQATALTPAQVARLGRSAAAALPPRVVRALLPESLKAMRPAAFASLSDAARKSMTMSQLRALTPRQLRALSPAQLAVWSPAQRAALNFG